MLALAVLGFVHLAYQRVRSSDPFWDNSVTFSITVCMLCLSFCVSSSSCILVVPTFWLWRPCGPERQVATRCLRPAKVISSQPVSF